MTGPLHVVLVEDHPLTRAGLRTALERGGTLVVTGESGDGLAAEPLIAELRPDVAIVDVGLPGRDGIELTRALKARWSELRIVILTMHEIEDEVLAALCAGADAYCVKSSDVASVVDAVRIVAAGGAYFDPAIAHIVLHRLGAPAATAAGSPLSPREREVLRLVADGIGNAAIAERLQIGLGTVKGHVRDILVKLSAADRTQAAVNALRRGYL